ncbi:MAG TPA: Ig-like domain-containing protein [Solirubrobacteraceae bacterium]
MRRISLAALCATIPALLSAQAATAATLSSAVGTGNVATYIGAPGQTSNLTISSVSATQIRIDRETSSTPTPADDDPIVESGDCVEDTGPDDIVCTAGSIVVSTGDGADTVRAAGLDQHEITINGGEGEDTLSDGRLDDEVNGEGGADVIGAALFGPAFFTGDRDEYDGGGGEDSLILLSGPDDIRGGAGIDRILFIAIDPVGPTPADVPVSLDDVANDGGDGLANARTDVEDIAGAVSLLADIPGLPFPPFPAAEGTATLRGDGDINSIVGGSGDDDVDPGANNDLVNTADGSDTVRTVDGFADRVVCGAGSDTAEADTLDVVSPSCESVTRTDAGNANDVPNPPVAPDVPEDLPPSVQFTSPAPGALTSGVTTLTASATDDLGVGQVLFIDDDRVVCADTVAPYTCDYQPRAEDVGRNTLLVMAVDTAQQTATAFRAFSVPRFAAALSIRVGPKRDASLPLRFRTSGALGLPQQVGAALGCAGGFVAVQVKAGRTTISNRRVRVRSDCTYSSVVTFRNRKRFRTRRSLRVVAVYAGNAVLDSARSETKTVRIT